MLDWFVTPQQVPNVVLNAQTRWLPVIAEPYIRRNGSWQMLPGAETFKTTSAAALGSGAALVIWTAAANQTIYLTNLTLSASVTGFYELQYAGVAIMRVLLTASQPLVIPCGGCGVFMASAAGLLRVLNNTAGVSDVYASAWGVEVTF